MKRKIILLAGPTASGKTKIAIKLAKRINGEIINADSMQVYKDFQILSSRPSKNELRLAKHHLYGFQSSGAIFSTGKWLKLASDKINQIVKKGKVPILVGGTGLYFKAITDGISKIPNIKFSVSYAGSLPMEYRKFEGVDGDWEQQHSQIYNYISYWELYKLMTLDETGKTNRQAILVYNDQDDCCFYNPYAQHFKSILDELNEGS